MREPWSSGYGRRLISRRLWVQILAPDTAWTFFTFISRKNVMIVRKNENNEKEAGDGSFGQKALWKIWLLNAKIYSESSHNVAALNVWFVG